MNITTAILAALLALGSASAFAEGGAERMRHYYQNFPVHHDAAGQQADSKADELKVPDDQTAQVTESYRP
ncbi:MULTISPECIES: hypothetical protein [unclassified Pseudomonas]|uniref:hypothetical protein n=1 Tax=unclassified Pseudomonas TaxID=196821 RepID=UPI000A1E7EFF|nr:MULTISPECIES: hypothetical protein [unclassified Pseudomonas]